MISEVLNALVLTYLASEYLVASQNSNNPWQHQPILDRLKTVVWHPKNRPVLLLILLVLVINVLERQTTATSELLHRFWHIPKIFWAAVAYIVALYWDCRRAEPELSLILFSCNVGMAFLTVLPIYPFLAVLISFGFLLCISLFEHLHISLDWLQGPIYYGTLYGPFSFVYFTVKRKVLQEHNSLPTSSSSSHSTWC